MSNLLVDDVQKQNPGSELIELFEIEISDGVFIYLHPGLTENLDEVRFRNKTTPSFINSYMAMPIEISGVEYSSDGAQVRPTLTVANVLTTFKDLLDGLTNEDLIGRRVTVRKTLRKYLYGEEEDSNPPYEFPSKTFVIDRISGETAVAIEFELASPFDLEGVELPNRVVVGKYCSWIFQGASVGKGGCTWPANSIMYYPNSSGTLVSHKVYFTYDDEPIVSISAISGAYNPATEYNKDVYVSDAGSYWVSKADENQGNTPGASTLWWQRVRVGATWSGSGVSYSVDSFVEYNNAAWRAKAAHISTTSNFPYLGSKIWERADVCGKQLSSCKCRFQFIPTDTENTNSSPSVDKNTTVPLPFGAFPGAIKFR